MWKVTANASLVMPGSFTQRSIQCRARCLHRHSPGLQQALLSSHETLVTLQRCAVPCVFVCKSRTSFMIRASSSSSQQPSWAELLEQRRRERLKGSSAAHPAASSEPPGSKSHIRREQEAHPDSFEGELGAAARAELDRHAQRMQLFAYPSSRQVPWATLVLLAASGGITTMAALYWNQFVCKSASLDELQPRIGTFMAGLQACSCSSAGLARGELHSLVLTSLLRAGEQPARLLADGAVLICCGTLVERLHGPGRLLALVVGSTVVSNALAPILDNAFLAPTPASSEVVSITSTSGGIVALGIFCCLRYSRWAVWPGVPIPVTWLLAPVLVADLLAARCYWQELPEYQQAIIPAGNSSPDAALGSSPGQQGQEEASEVQEGTSALQGLELAVALTACDGVSDHARTECRPGPDDVEAWREELDRAAEVAGRMLLAPCLLCCWR